MTDPDATGGAPVSGALSVAFILAWLQVMGGVLACVMSLLILRRPGSVAAVTLSAGLLAASILFLRRDDRARIFLAGESILFAVASVLGAIASMAYSSPAVFLFALPLLFSLAGAFSFTAPSVREWTK